MAVLEDRLKNKLEKFLRCPVCALLDDFEFDVLCTLQFDVIHDNTLRNTIASEGGFCDFHFRQFRKVANSKTNALLLLAIINHYMQSNMEYSLHCRLCKASAEYEHTLLASFLSLIEDSAFREVYANQCGLCIGHLGSLLAIDTTVTMKAWLNEVLRATVRKDIPALQEMATLSYFETAPSSRGSIVRSTERFAGRRAF